MSFAWTTEIHIVIFGVNFRSNWVHVGLALDPGGDDGLIFN